MLQSEIVVVLLIFIPRSYKPQNSYIGLDSSFGQIFNDFDMVFLPLKG